MDNLGWIRLYRRIQDNELWLMEKFTRAQAWIDLLLMANHKDSMFFLRGNEVHVKRGQIARSEETLAKRWRWSRDKVRRFLEWLKTRQQIRQQQSTIINILEIINYEKYQQNDTTDKTTERQQKNNRQDTYNNVKNDKNEKKEEYPENSKEFQLSLFCKDKILENYPRFTHYFDSKNFQKYCDCMNKLIRIDKKTDEEIKNAIIFATEDEFWKKQFQSPLKLRKPNNDGIKYIDVFLSKADSGDFIKPFDLEGLQADLKIIRERRGEDEV